MRGIKNNEFPNNANINSTDNGTSNNLFLNNAPNL